MSPRALNKPRNARIMELYDEGLTWQAIADKLGTDGRGRDEGRITRQNVGRIIHEELERGEK